jgi:hypothetical protein
VPSTDRRAALLDRNAGLWEGTFIRLDGEGRELERFPTSLAVSEEAGTISAALTYRHTGRVATMRFAEPPAEMAIDPAGHWSLGPDRTGPWPCLTELCLVAGERRRRVVVRHGAERLEAVVLVCEGRPGGSEHGPAAPLQARIQALPGSPGRVLWQLEPGVELDTVAVRGADTALISELRWRPEGRDWLTIRRGYGANGLPLA